MDCTLQIDYSALGLTGTGRVTRAAEGGVVIDEALDPGIAATLVDRTDEDEAALSAASGHGITNADTLVVFWEGGLRYGMTVIVTAGSGGTDSLAVAGGFGDALPAEETALVLGVQVDVSNTAEFDGDNAVLLLAIATRRAHLVFQTAGEAEIAPFELPAGELVSWVAGSGLANPLAGETVGIVLAACGDVAGAGLQVAIPLA